MVLLARPHYETEIKFFSDLIRKTDAKPLTAAEIKANVVRKLMGNGGKANGNDSVRTGRADLS